MRELVKLAAVLGSVLAIVGGGRTEHFHHILQGLIMVSAGIILLSVATGATAMPGGQDA